MTQAAESLPACCSLSDRVLCAASAASDGDEPAFLVFGATRPIDNGAVWKNLAIDFEVPASVANTSEIFPIGVGE